MLKFAVYDEEGPAERWPLAFAHLLGPEDMAIPGEVRFQKGHIVCRRPGGAAAALSLQHEAGPKGNLLLQTCLLPDRDRPYGLSIELARHRIKMFLVKSEEWQLFDLDPEHAAVTTWEKARRLFTESIIARDPLVADRAASRALRHAIDATERLALVHADILLHRRYAQRAASSAAFGVRVWPERTGRGLEELIARDFDVIQLPICWKKLEVEEGQYRWEPLDRWVEWARAAGKPIVAGPLVDFSKRCLPAWMSVWEHDYETCRDLAYDHVEKILRRYRGAIGMWNLASGIPLNDNFRFTPDQMVDLVRMASLLVKQTSGGARSMVEVVQPFGEATADGRGAIAPMAFLDRLVQEGIRVDAIGVQLLFGAAAPGRAMRDLMQISSMLDRFFFLELPVLVSAAGVPSEPGDPKGGCWHEAWSEAQQARWASRVFVVAMSKPYVESFFWGDLYDHGDTEVPAAGLIGADGRAKSALRKLVSVRRRLRRPLGAMKSSPLITPAPEP